MTSEFDKPKPTIADEASPAIDDGVVIEKTLPVAAGDSTGEKIGYLDNVLVWTEDYVRANPVQSALLAAGGGALLAKLLVLSLGRQRNRRG